VSCHRAIDRIQLTYAYGHGSCNRHDAIAM
jgi:hypothetical protein